MSLMLVGVPFLLCATCWHDAVEGILAATISVSRDQIRLPVQIQLQPPHHVGPQFVTLLNIFRIYVIATCPTKWPNSALAVRQSTASQSPAQTNIFLPAFNHTPSSSTEAEYERLRNLAHQEISKKQSLSRQSHEAYQAGDGAQAHQLSEEAKRHQQQADAYNKQASDYIFRANNANIPGDTIDLHGQYVEEAERILGERVRYAQSTGQGHLHVIVGKGNHSAAHVQKIKPAVEELCRELGLRYRTEENEGRMYVDLSGGGDGTGYVDEQPPPLPGDFGHQYGQGYQQGGYGGGGYGAGPQPQPQQEEEQDLLTLICSACKSCTVM